MRLIIDRGLSDSRQAPADVKLRQDASTQVDRHTNDNYLGNMLRRHSTALPVLLETSPTSSVRSVVTPRGVKGQGLTMPFKLYSMLEDERNESIISWLPGGKTWKIHNIEAFTRSLLPQYFDYGSRNLTMFTKLLKLWNFSASKKAGSTTFYHQVSSEVTQLTCVEYLLSYAVAHYEIISFLLSISQKARHI